MTGVPAVDLLLTIWLASVVAQIAVTFYGGRHGWSTRKVFLTCMTIGAVMLATTATLLGLGFAGIVIIGVFFAFSALWWVGFRPMGARRGAVADRPGGNGPDT